MLRVIKSMGYRKYGQEEGTVATIEGERERAREGKADANSSSASLNKVGEM